MKNRNIQFQATTLLLIPLLLAWFVTVFTSAPTPAVATDRVPFNGTASGFVETQEPVDQCTIHAHVINFGNANQLGAFTGTAESYPNFCDDPPNITYTGTFDWFAANGDEFYGTFDGYLTPTATPGLMTTTSRQTWQVVQVGLATPLGILSWADNWTSARIQSPLSFPGKGGSQLSVRTSTRNARVSRNLESDLDSPRVNVQNEFSLVRRGFG